MSKFIKGCCITAVVFILIGGITLAVSIAFGGRLAMRTLLTENNYSIFGKFDGVDFEDDWNSDYNESYYGNYSDSEIATKDEVNNLQIQIGAAKVDIVESDNEYFQVTGNTDYPYKCYMENNTLVLKGLINKGLYKWNSENDFLNRNHITLSIPKDVSFDDVTIEIGGGMLNVNSLNTNSLTMEGGASYLVIDKLIANYTDVEMGAGSLEIMDADLQDAEFDIALGNLEFEGIITKDMSLTCGLGSITMDLKDKEESHNYELDASVGRVSIGNISQTSLGRSNYINNNVNSTYDIECGLGSISIDFE